MEEIHRAIHETVLSAGPKELANKMGMSHTTLLNRANPNDDSHRLNVEQLLQIMLHSGDSLVLQAMAAEFGYELVKRGAVEAKALMASLVSAGKEVADLTLAVHEALEDRHVSQVEKAAIKREIAHVRESLDVMEASVKVA